MSMPGDIRVGAKRKQAQEQEEAHEAAKKEKEAAKKEAAQKEAAQKEAAKKEAAQKEAAQKEAAKKEAAKKEAAQKEAAQKEAAQKEAAQKEAAKKEAAKKEAAKKEAENSENNATSSNDLATNSALEEDSSELSSEATRRYDQQKHDPARIEQVAERVSQAAVLDERLLEPEAQSFTSENPEPLDIEDLELEESSTIDRASTFDKAQNLDPFPPPTPAEIEENAPTSHRLALQKQESKRIAIKQKKGTRGKKLLSLVAAAMILAGLVFAGYRYTEYEAVQTRQALFERADTLIRAGGRANVLAGLKELKKLNEDSKRANNLLSLGQVQRKLMMSGQNDALINPKERKGLSKEALTFIEGVTRFRAGDLEAAGESLGPAKTRLGTAAAYFASILAEQERVDQARSVLIEANNAFSGNGALIVSLAALPQTAASKRQKLLNENRSAIGPNGSLLSNDFRLLYHAANIRTLKSDEDIKGALAELAEHEANWGENFWALNAIGDLAKRHKVTTAYRKAIEAITHLRPDRADMKDVKLTLAQADHDGKAVLSILGDGDWRTFEPGKQGDILKAAVWSGNMPLVNDFVDAFKTGSWKPDLTDDEEHQLRITWVEALALSGNISDAQRLAGPLAATKAADTKIAYAMLQFLAGRQESAERHLDFAIKIPDLTDGERSKLHSWRALVNLGSGHIEAAKESVKNALALDGEQGLALRIAGELAIYDGDLSAAETAFSKLDHNTKSAGFVGAKTAAAFGLEFVTFLKGEKLDTLTPTPADQSPFAVRMRAEMLLLQGDIKGARAMLGIAGEFLRRDVRLVAINAHTSLLEGKPEQARRLQKEVLRGWPTHFLARLGRAEIMLRSGKADTSLKLLSEIELTAEANLPQRKSLVLLTRGRALIELKRFSDARAVLEAASKIGNAPTEVWFYLGEALTSVDAARAKEAYQAYLNRVDSGALAERARKAIAPKQP